jgi:hypothetical protein
MLVNTKKKYINTNFLFIPLKGEFVKNDLKFIGYRS